MTDETRPEGVGAPGPPLSSPGGESAVRAAAAVGDDRLQRMATGTVSPETWTHGSSAERTKWFSRGFHEGKLESCDTSGSL